ncbi:MAG: porin [Alphaproteobacteria bacterium]|nr:porin [Alphaproteobacteria bacterium]
MGQLTDGAVDADRIPDQGSLVNSGKKGMTFELSGQVNMGVMFADTGSGPALGTPIGTTPDNDRKVWIVDNDTSSSRFRFIVKAPIDDVWSAGATVELELEQNASNEVNQTDASTRAFDFNLRKGEAWLKNKSWGKFWIGQGDTATNGITEQDLSGTKVIAKSDVQTVGGGLIFRDANGMLNAGLLDVADFFNNLDGLSRKQRVRYDTPTFAGFSLATSYSDGGFYDVRVQHTQKYPALGGLKVAAAAGWYDGTDSAGSGKEGFGGSASILHVPTGLNISGAHGQVLDTDGDTEPHFYYLKGGWQGNLFDFGKTALSADAFIGEDYEQDGSTSDAYGFQLVQNIDASNTELYAGGRVFEVENPGDDFQDIWTGMVGVRQKF